MRDVSTRRNFLGLCSAAAALAAIPSVAAAQVLSPDQIALRIKLEGQQRMLSQRLIKAAGFLKYGVREQQMLDQIRDMRASFDDTLNGFMHGTGNSGLERERAVTVQLILREIAADWASIQGDIEQILASGTVTDAQFVLLQEHGDFLELKNTEAEHALVEIYGDHGVDVAVAKTLEFIERQAMLTQRLAKDLIMIKLGYHPKTARAEFDETAQYFEQTLLVLRTNAASYGLAKPDPATMKMLDDIWVIWQDKRPGIQAVVDGSNKTKDQLAKFIDQNEELLQLSVDAATQYQSFGAGA